MIKVPAPKTPAQVKRLSSDKVKNEYNALAEEFNKIISNDIVYCAKCGMYHAPDAFYESTEFKVGRFPICKKCLSEMASDYDKRKDSYTDNRDKLLRVFHMLDLPYSDDAYKSFKEKAPDGMGVANMMISQVYAWAHLHDKTWADGTTERKDETTADGAVRDEIKKIFGRGLSDDDYLFLQDQYDDWRARTQVDSKSQETYVQQICLQLLDIDKDRKAGRDCTNKLQALDKLMCSANLQPKQNVANAASENLSMGQWIEKVETTRPVPEPDEEFKDVNGIGKYIRVWFSGWLSFVLGFKNAYTKEFEEYVAKYRVENPQFDLDESSDEIYSLLFGNKEV